MLEADLLPALDGFPPLAVISVHGTLDRPVAVHVLLKEKINLFSS